MAAEVPARVGKGIIKAIKPTGVGVAVPPPQFTNKIKTSEPRQKTADFQLQATKTPTP